MPGERAEPAEALREQLGMGRRRPQISDPAYLAVSRVSLGRGYLDALGRWPSTRLGGELFSKTFGLGSPGDFQGVRASAMPVEPLVQVWVQTPRGEPSPLKTWENSWVGGGALKKSNPAYLAVSRVSLGRGYLVVRVRWTESPSGVRVFKFFFRWTEAWAVAGRFGSEDRLPEIQAPARKDPPGRLPPDTPARVGKPTLKKRLSRSACQEALSINDCQKAPQTKAPQTKAPRST
jgi:hypothetical protein